MWVINKEDAIAGNTKNVHFSIMPTLQAMSLADDVVKGDFSRFPTGGDVLNNTALYKFKYTRLAPTWGLRYVGAKSNGELTPSELLYRFYIEAINQSVTIPPLQYCFAISPEGLTQCELVYKTPTESGNYLYINQNTDENELITIEE